MATEEERRETVKNSLRRFGGEGSKLGEVIKLAKPWLYDVTNPYELDEMDEALRLALMQMKDYQHSPSLKQTVREWRTEYIESITFRGEYRQRLDAYVQAALTGLLANPENSDQNPEVSDDDILLRAYIMGSNTMSVVDETMRLMNERNSKG